MKCINAEKLLPLYARLDLDKKSHSAVAAHLESCTHCRQLADEYKNLQSWIRVYEPPEFSEEFFADIRQNVLREVGQRSAASATFSAWLRKLVVPTLPKTMFAGATAALLIISFAIGLLVFRETPKPEPQNDVTVYTKPVPLPTEEKSQAPTEVKNGSQVAFNGSSGNNVKRVRHRIARTPAATRLPAQDTLASSTELTATAPLRVEMQTQDPNIRIIWFAPNTKHIN